MTTPSPIAALASDFETAVGLPARRDGIAGLFPPGGALRRIAVPLALFALANVWLLGFGGDRWLASHVYAWEGGRWALRDVYMTTSVIHVFGKHLSTAAWLLVVALAIVAWRRPVWASLRRPAVCLALSVLLSTTIVAWLKHTTHMDCPWDAALYGGSHPYFGLFDARPAHLRTSGCFPGGHASAGYAWVALYFFFLSVRREWRWAGLGIGLAAGLIFGVSQQLRGAHFMSHDVWTLMICWTVAVTLHALTVRWSLARAALAAARHSRSRAGFAQRARR
jgi:membrane-associated PAP2 superfamily phosphatase